MCPLRKMNLHQASWGAIILLKPCSPIILARFLAIGGDLVSTGCRRPLVACGGSHEITLKIAQTKIHGEYNYAMAA